ncbi:MAG: hypothetical protein ACLQVL_29565 [Terriglobia bacterium]
MSLIPLFLRYGGGVVFLIGVLVFIYDIRHGAQNYCKMLKVVWPKETAGEGLVGAVNKGGVTICSVILLVFFVDSELKEWFRPETKPWPWFFWLICFSAVVGLLAISILVLASIERGKQLIAPRRNEIEK